MQQSGHLLGKDALGQLVPGVRAFKEVFYDNVTPVKLLTNSPDQFKFVSSRPNQHTSQTAKVESNCHVHCLDIGT